MLPSRRFATDLIVNATIAKDLHIVPLIPGLDDLLSLFRILQVGSSDTAQQRRFNQWLGRLGRDRTSGSLVDVDKRP
jgi:hypothetical protein